MITFLNFREISQLLIATSLTGKLPVLEEKLSCSKKVSSNLVPPDLVTMNSEILFDDLTTSERITVRLVYQLGLIHGNQASILSPLGTALLGMRVSESATYELRNGELRTIHIVQKINRLREGL